MENLKVLFSPPLVIRFSVKVCGTKGTWFRQKVIFVRAIGGPKEFAQVLARSTRGIFEFRVLSYYMIGTDIIPEGIKAQMGVCEEYTAWNAVDVLYLAAFLTSIDNQRFLRQMKWAKPWPKIGANK